MKVIASGLFSVFFAWAVAFFFKDSIRLYDFDPLLNKYVVSPGLKIKHRSEGWGTTLLGEHGVIAVPDIKKVQSDKIAIFGDSFVEGFQVDDFDKMSHIFNSLYSSSKVKNKLAGFSVGFSGDDIADYYFNIPKYEKIVPDIKAYFIVITGFNDTIPNMDNARSVFKFDGSSYYLLEKEKIRSDLAERIKNILRPYGFNFLIGLANTAYADVELDFIPSISTRNTKQNQSTLKSPALQEAWSFLLKELNHQTTGKIIFVYAPPVPRVEKGKITFEDKNYDMVNTFKNECLIYNMGFIDMRDSFNHFFKATELY